MYSSFEEGQCLESMVRMRKQRGLTQKQVEQELELRALSIYDYESGRLKLSVELAVKLSNLYHCRIEELIGLQREVKNEESPSMKLISLSSLGLMGGRQKVFSQDVLKDPIILAELGEMEFEFPESPYEMLVKALSETQKRSFSIELLKYVNSLIGVDQKVSTEEITLRDYLIDDMEFDFSDSELMAIKKALSSKYFGKSVDKKFPRKALRHFLIWTLFIVAMSDGAIDHREDEYIEEAAAHIGVKKKDYEFIKKNIKQTWESYKE